MRTVYILAVSFLFTFSGALAQENLASDEFVPSEKDVVVDSSAEVELIDDALLPVACIVAGALLK